MGDRMAKEDVVVPDTAEVEKLKAEVQRLRAAILDIDAHATAVGSDEDGFNSGGYIVSLGAIHRALGLLGRTGIKKREHAVSIELAHGDGCDGCQKMKLYVLDAIGQSAVTRYRENFGRPNSGPCTVVEL